MITSPARVWSPGRPLSRGNNSAGLIMIMIMMIMIIIMIMILMIIAITRRRRPFSMGKPQRQNLGRGSEWHGTLRELLTSDCLRGEATHVSA